MGCAFVPGEITDPFIKERCAAHDKVYQNVDATWRDKFRADWRLGSSIFMHGLILFVSGAWFMALGVLMWLVTSLLGWYAWRWAKRHK